MNDTVVLSTNIEGLPPPRRGKVRDIYETDEHLLIVATDRVSAFDVVLPDGIPAIALFAFTGLVPSAAAALPDDDLLLYR